MAKIKSTSMWIIGITLMITILLSGCVEEDKNHQNYTSSTPMVNLSSADNSSEEEKANTSSENEKIFNENVEYTIYKNNDFNFSMEYPKTWKPIIKDNSKIVFVSDQKDTAGYVTISIQILSSNKTGGEYFTVKDVLNDLVEQFKEKAKNFSIHYTNNVALGNVKGMEIKVSYELDNTKYVQAITVAEGNDYFYAVMYLSSPKYYDKYVKIYEHAKSTFNLSIVNSVLYENKTEVKIEAEHPITNKTDNCSICEERSGDQKAWCYAVCSGNISLCENLQNREDCIRNIAVQNKDISLCETLNQPKKDICIQMIKDISKNESSGGGRSEGKL